MEPLSKLGNPLTPHSDITKNKSLAAENYARMSDPDKLAAANPTPQVQQTIPPVHVDCLTEPATSTSHTTARSALPSVEKQPLRRNTRTRKPPDRFQDKEFAN
ncbi:hypothetical protein MTO96_050506 [Rhipicephalus appendiculatus]